VEIQLRKLEKKDLPQIAGLEEYLWGSSIDYRKELLHWKYIEVPEYTCLGAVAVDNGRIVGFRGLVASRWETNQGEISTVCFTDAVVDPGYRGKGLLASLNSFLEETYKDEFDFIMVLFPNNISGHIYKKQKIHSFFAVHFFFRKLIVNRLKKTEPYEQVNDFKEISRLLTNCYADSKDIIKFKYTKQYLLWKLVEPKRKFIVLKSKINSFSFVIFEEKKYSLEILYLPNSQINSGLDLIEGYAIKQKKLYISLPVSENLRLDLKDNITNAGYKKFSSINKLKPNFYSKKEILIRPFNLSNKNKRLDMLIDDPKIWEYQHLIYV
jgi:GNAT superfamily N-acetyltransferase